MKSKKYRNEIELAGRAGKEVTERELPSGDKVVEFRIIVERDDREGFDTLDIAVWKPSLRRRALGLKAEEWIIVKGVLRRRFWRAGSAISSRWQVEARDLARI